MILLKKIMRKIFKLTGLNITESLQSRVCTVYPYNVCIWICNKHSHNIVSLGLSELLSKKMKECTLVYKN